MAQDSSTKASGAKLLSIVIHQYSIIYESCSTEAELEAYVIEDHELLMLVVLYSDSGSRSINTLLMQIGA